MATTKCPPLDTLAALAAKESSPAQAAAQQPAPAVKTPGKCPYDSDNDDTQPESGGKCPYSAGKTSTTTTAAAAAASTSSGRCPFDAVEGTKSWSDATGAELKEHFAKAYNAVADSAQGKTGTREVATLLMQQMGYDQEELGIIGDDVWMMQGTGSPHLRAMIGPGEFVVDLGSGFGLDAIIAGVRVGPRGRVVGIDLAAKEVLNALERVAKRGVRNVDFRIGDIEHPPFEDGSVDVAISNGGFCLVPDKAQAFREIFRFLKPGGRCAISCTVRVKPLAAGKKWPSCMVAFASIETLLPILSDCGFVRCEIDRSTSNVDVWDDATKHDQYDEKEDVESPIHKTHHAGYAHLADMNMNDYFERVTIVGVKPSA